MSRRKARAWQATPAAVSRDAKAQLLVRVACATASETRMFRVCRWLPAVSLRSQSAPPPPPRQSIPYLQLRRVVVTERLLPRSGGCWSL